MRRDRELGRRLRETELPDEAEAERRGWEIVRAAHAERSPVRPSRTARRWGLAGAVAVAALAIGLSPAGAKVGDLVSDVTGIGDQDAKPQLRSLPAAGELLVESPQGPWVVREDGSKRLLGDYSEASWSPHGRFVAVAGERELVAVDPEGEVQWTLPTRGRPMDIRWEGSELDTRIAYRAGGDLHVVSGDGLGAHRVARDVSATPPRWLRPPGLTKVEPALAGRFPYSLAYLDRSGNPQVVDPDTGESLNIHVGRAHQRQLSGAAVPSPLGGRTAALVRQHGHAVLSVRGDGERRVVLSVPGRITGPTWSPDGRWLLVGWPAADQWLFIEADRPRHVVAFDRISEQFDPGGSGGGRFPRVSGWVLPER